MFAVGILAASAWAQAPAAAPAGKAPAVKDQGEYDLTQSIQKEADPQKKLDLINQWEQKYPDSDFKGPRLLTRMQTESAVAVKGAQPNAAAGDVDAAQKGAQSLADNLEKYFADENKPAAFHRMAEFWFESAAAMQACFDSPEAKAASDDLQNFATGGVTLFVSEVVG